MLPVTNGLYGVYRLDSVRRSKLRLPSDCHCHAERAVVDSRAARSPQSRVAGNRDRSGLRIRVRNGDGRRRAVRCAIHMVPGMWRASGGLVGGPALAAENELASSISAMTILAMRIVIERRKIVSMRL
jgi:hypothetical protein